MTFATAAIRATPTASMNHGAMSDTKDIRIDDLFRSIIIIVIAAMYYSKRGNKPQLKQFRARGLCACRLLNNMPRPRPGRALE